MMSFAKAKLAGLAAAALFAWAGAAAAQTTVKLCVPVISTASGLPVTSCQDVATANPLPVTVVSGGGSNASVGANGTVAPTSSTQVGILGSDGNLRPTFDASNPVMGSAADYGFMTSVIAGNGPGGVTNIGALMVNSDAFAVSIYSLADASFGYLFNGTTWDRARGDATNGAWVNVKTSVPKAAALTTAGCTVGSSSAQCLAGSLVTAHLMVQNVSTGSTNNIACNFGGTAILNNSGSFQLTPGQSANWGGATAVVPTGALDCISTAGSAPLYVEYN